MRVFRSLKKTDVLPQCVNYAVSREDTKADRGAQHYSTLPVRQQDATDAWWTVAVFRANSLQTLQSGPIGRPVGIIKAS